MRVTMIRTTVASDDHVTVRTYLAGETYEVSPELGTILVAQEDAALADPAAPTSLAVFEVDCGSPLAASATACHPGITGSNVPQLGVTAGIVQPDVARNFTAKASAAGTPQAETGTVVGTISVGVLQQETGTVIGTVVTGQAQQETASVVGSIINPGNASVVVTAAGMPNSPKTVLVAVLALDDASAVGGKIRVALGLDADVSGYFTIGGATNAVLLTRKAAAADDGTLNVSVDNGTCTGLTTEGTSADTLAGIAPGNGNATVIVTAAALAGSPKTYNVAVAAGDNAAAVAGKIRTALGLDAALTTLFTVGGTSADVSLTAKADLANDTSLNVDIDNGTCVGLTDAPTSVDTTAGSVVGTGNASVTVTAAGLANSPKTYAVPVVAGDNAAAVGGKIRTALGLDAALTALFTVGGSGADVKLTAKGSNANDGTLNIAITNGTCAGLTPELSSSHTTAGVAGVTGNVVLHASLGGIIDSETITLSGSSVIAGLKAFDTLISVDRPAGGGTVAIGTGELIGLRRAMPRLRLLAVYHDGDPEMDGKAYAVDSVTFDPIHANLTVVDMTKLTSPSDGNSLVAAVWGE